MFKTLNKVNLPASLTKGNFSSSTRLARASARIDQVCSWATKPVSRFAKAVTVTLAESVCTRPVDGKALKTSRTGEKRGKKVTLLKSCLKTIRFESGTEQPNEDSDIRREAKGPGAHLAYYWVQVLGQVGGAEPWGDPEPVFPIISILIRLQIGEASS